MMVGATVASAQTPLEQPTAETAFQAGVFALKNAELAVSEDDRIANLHKARQQFAKAVRLQPDYYLAEALWARSFEALVRESDESNLVTVAERTLFTREALTHYAAAEKCTGADSRLYLDWSRFLRFHAAKLASAYTMKQTDLDAAQKLLRKGLSMADGQSDLLDIQAELAQCLTALAPLTNDERQRLANCREAIKLFETVAEARTISPRSDFLTAWGTALLESGRIDRNKTPLNEAVQKLTVARTKDPLSQEARYLLARTYAVLGQQTEAFRELQTVLEDDPRRAWFERASKDHDFDALLSSPKYRAVLDDKTAQDRLALGLDLSKQANNAPENDKAVELLEQAAQAFAEANQLQPDCNAALESWAQCLTQLAKRASKRAQQLKYAESAKEQFARAATLTATPRLYLQWGAFLRYVGEDLATNPADRLLAIRESAKVLRQGLVLRGTASDQTLISRELAMTLTLQALADQRPTERGWALQRAVKLFTASSSGSPPLESVHAFNLWGAALVQLGKLQNDRFMIRQGIEQLLTAFEKEPRNCDTNYKLACAYALTEQPYHAMRHLRIGLDNDRSRALYRTAAGDPDLDSLRKTREFKEMFEKPASDAKD